MDTLVVGGRAHAACRADRGRHQRQVAGALDVIVMPEMREWVGGHRPIVLWAVRWVGGALPVASFAVLDWHEIRGCLGVHLG